MNKIKCDKCGSEVDSNAKFCPNCGAKIESTEKAERVEVVEATVKENSGNKVNNTEIGYNVMSIVGFVLSFILIPKFCLVALVISIIALVQISKTKEKGKGLAIAGIAISSSIVIIGLIALIFALGVGFISWLF